MAQDWDALDILSKAKLAALDAIHDRQAAFARHYYQGGPAPEQSLYFYLDIWRTVENAWDRVLRDNR
jgi:hypothetical protein